MSSSFLDILKANKKEKQTPPLYITCDSSVISLIMSGVGLKSLTRLYCIANALQKTSEWPQRQCSGTHDGPILKAEAQLDKAPCINRYPLISQTGSYMEQQTELE
jgi:hypothetical protein